MLFNPFALLLVFIIACGISYNFGFKYGGKESAVIGLDLAIRICEEIDWQSYSCKLLVNKLNESYQEVRND